jgi:hypothetical protein
MFGDASQDADTVTRELPTPVNRETAKFGGRSFVAGHPPHHITCTIGSRGASL